LIVVLESLRTVVLSGIVFSIVTFPMGSVELSTLD